MERTLNCALINVEGTLPDELAKQFAEEAQGRAEECDLGFFKLVIDEQHLANIPKAILSFRDDFGVMISVEGYEEHLPRCREANE